MKLTDMNWTAVDRSLIIGGTDISVLLGVNKWKTKEELFQEKIGNSVVKMNDGMYWGTMAEPMIARHIANNLPSEHELFDPENPATIMSDVQSDFEFDWLPGHQIEHKDYPFIVGSPDRLVVDKGTFEVVEGIEIKTAFEWTLKAWKKEIPKYYQIQCQAYMMVTGLETWKLCALIGNRTYLEFDLEADLLLHEEMIEESIKFNDELNKHTEENAKEALVDYEKLLTRQDEKKISIPMGRTKT